MLFAHGFGCDQHMWRHVAPRFEATYRVVLFDATECRQYVAELLRAKQRAEEAAEQARLLARTLQQTLIPPAPPDKPRP